MTNILIKNALEGSSNMTNVTQFFVGNFPQSKAQDVHKFVFRFYGFLFSFRYTDEEKLLGNIRLQITFFYNTTAVERYNLWSFDCSRLYVLDYV